MTKPSNEDIVKTLRDVRDFISGWGSGAFICHTVCALASDNAVRNYILKLVERRLRGCATYEDWLKKYHPDISPKGAWRGRVQWIDALIAEHGGTP